MAWLNPSNLSKGTMDNLLLSHFWTRARLASYPPWRERDGSH